MVALYVVYFNTEKEEASDVEIILPTARMGGTYTTVLAIRESFLLMRHT